MKISGNAIYIIGAIGLGVVILFVSLARAGFSTFAVDDCDKLRVLPIEFKIDDEICSYKLPGVGTLSSSPIYRLKRMRDRLWEGFDNNPVKKAEIMLFMADKKMAEVIELSKQGQNELALDRCIEAVNKLKYADGLLNEVKDRENGVDELDNQIYRAGLAYREIIEASCKPLINDIDNWNENYKKNKKEN